MDTSINMDNKNNDHEEGEDNISWGTTNIESSMNYKDTKILWEKDPDTDLVARIDN